MSVLSNVGGAAEDAAKDLLMKQLKKLVDENLPDAIPQSVVDAALKEVEKQLNEFTIIPNR